MKFGPVLAAALVGMVGFTGMSQAASIQYTAFLSGGAEDPPVVSNGSGSAVVIVDTVARTFSLDVDFTGLTGMTMAAHIHGPVMPPMTNAGVMTQTPTFIGFPLGVMSGTYSESFDMTNAATWNSAFVTAQGSVAQAEATFLSALAGNAAYLNIHTSFAPGGEIRGFLAPVPLPAGALLSLTALGALGALRARRRS